MHMPAGSPRAPILSCDAREQLAGLRRALAPQRWPLDPALLPADALLVGGSVRDALLGRLGERPDLDLVVEGDAIALARDLARRCGGSCVVLDAERSIARLVIQGWSFDLARRMGASLKQDLARRDYSVNAIALPLADLCGSGSDTTPAGPIDPCGGLADLRARRLRALGEANLLEDPLRLLRGVRLACELGFAIDAQTLAWIRTHHPRLGQVAGERVLAELERLAGAPAGAEGLRQALELGLLQSWQGRQQPDQRPVAHRPEAETADWLEQLTPLLAERRGLTSQEQAWALPLARLAALLSPTALEQLRGSRRLQLRCRRLRQWLQRLDQRATPGVPAAATREAGLTLTGLPEADRLALHRELEEDLPALALQLQPHEAREALRRWRDGNDPLFHPRPPLDGLQLQQGLGIPPGRTLGELLTHLTGERAFGRLLDSDGPEPVLQEARDWLARCSSREAAPGSQGQAT